MRTIITGVRYINYSNLVIKITPLSIEETEKSIQLINRAPFTPTEYLNRIKEIHKRSIEKKKKILCFVTNSKCRNTNNNKTKRFDSINSNEDNRLSYTELKELNEIDTCFINIYNKNNMPCLPVCITV